MLVFSILNISIVTTGEHCLPVDSWKTGPVCCFLFHRWILFENYFDVIVTYYFKWENNCDGFNSAIFAVLKFLMNLKPPYSFNFL